METGPHRLEADEVVEDLLYGQLKVIQKKKGYRFSIDSILISHFVRIKSYDSIIDLGTGSGVIPLILSHRYEDNNITGIEINEDMVCMAKRSVQLNNLSEKINIVTGDLKEVRNIAKAESCSVIITNPPYGKAGSGRLSDGEAKASARHDVTGNVDVFLKAASYFLKYRGTMAVILPSRRLVDLIHGMRTCGIEPKRMRTVHSRKDDPAKLVMVEGVKGGGVEMAVEPPLYIYKDEENYSHEVELMYR